MKYLLDTVAIVRHFSGKGKIGNEAASLLAAIEEEKNEDEFIISVISLMEVMYLSEKNRIAISFAETLDAIKSSSKYSIANLSLDILAVAETVSFYELHDRLILATAKWLDVQIISSDGRFEEVEGVEVIWD